MIANPDEPANAEAFAALGSGGPRSATTRRAILDTARATFAARGYQQTTIRAVAAQAGIDPSMVMRYFGSKAGLFTAAATLNLPAPDLRSVTPDQRGEVLVRHVVQRWENSVADDNLVLLLRTAVTNDDVAAQLQAQINTLIIEPIAALGDPDAGHRAALIGTQLLGLALCRYILHLEPVTSMPLETLIRATAPVIQRYLTASIDDW